ncbi:MAG: phosphoesterase PA-phosphatase related protein [Bacteroidetes bacterium]|nr:phosphoesterase PA-phosphatase related protein [Bacteroidota bacterium]
MINKKIINHIFQIYLFFIMNLRSIKFNPAEKLTLYYILISTFVAFYINLKFGTGVSLIGIRLLISAVILFLAYQGSSREKSSINFIRYLFIGSLFVYWYSETFYFNRYFENFDHLLARADFQMFGFQPSIIFAQVFPQHWFSELMNLGYISFFPMLAFTCLYFYVTNRKYAEFFFFTTVLAFFLFYLLFFLIPASGPQYYFQLIDNKQISAGIYPSLGDYFSNNYISLRHTPPNGFFSFCLDFIRGDAERPTGAFPSSHIGNSTLVIILVLAIREYKLALLLSPLYVLLVLSTVYLGAHYVTDVIAGFISAFVFYGLSVYLYPLFSGNNHTDYKIENKKNSK